MGVAERRKRMKELHRNTILKAARRLFFEKGFKNVTVASIAKKADISKGAIYIHFKSKEEIYAEILLNDVERHHKTSSGLLKADQSACENILRITRSYVDFFLNDRELFRILMNYMLRIDHMSLPAELDQKIVTATNKSMDIIADALRQGIETGEFPAGINVRQNRNAVWGLLNGIISLYLFSGSEAKRVERIYSTVEACMAIYLKGLRIKGEQEAVFAPSRQAAEQK